MTADPFTEIAIMAPYAVNWQIKETANSLSDGVPIDMNRLLTINRQSGYRDYLPIETPLMKRKGYDPFIEVPKVLGELRKAIDETSSISPNQ